MDIIARVSQAILKNAMIIAQSEHIYMDMT